MPITEGGITDHQLTREEFALLGLIDSRHYLGSAGERFTEWDHSFATDHPDWHRRVEVQGALAHLFGEVVSQQPPPPADQRFKLIFLGASLGSIATYFHLAELARLGRLEDFELHILDYLWEPLVQTQQGNFKVSSQAEEDMGVKGVMSAAEYKTRLAKSQIHQGNIAEMPLEGASFDFVVAPYVQHHLNLLDKTRACLEMLRITRPGGVCLLGDLTFDYERFSRWLAEHESEQVPYALESFVPIDQHIALFEGTEEIGRREGSFYYAFAARRAA